MLIGLIVAVLLAGSVAYSLSQHVSVWHGFLFALDTVATVGSAPEPDDLPGQLTKVLLIVLGVGTLFYALATVTEFFVAGHLGEILEERRTLKKIEDLNGHHLICGFGRVGRQVARDLQVGGDDFVIIDSLDENKHIADQMGAPFLHGRPSEDEMLKAAGIERAISVLACVEDSEKKLLRAGADRVISPYKSSGAEMARLALQPQVTGVVDVAPEYRMEEIDVSAGCQAEGMTIGQVRGTTSIAALRNTDGQVHPQPSPDTVLRAGDVLVAMGTVDALRKLEAMFVPGAARKTGSVLSDPG